jgi:hypothetical protein
MAHPWNTYLDALKSCHDELSKIWDRDLEKSWKGDAANACHIAWRELSTNIGKLKEHYDNVPSILASSATLVTETTKAIPIPIFANNKLPGNRDGNPPDGSMLYDDYQDNRSEYADYAFRHQALREAQEQQTPQGVRVPQGRNSYTTGEAPGSADATAMVSRDEKLQKSAVESWYATHQATANQAHDHIVAEYSKTINQIPGPYGDSFAPEERSTGKKEKGSGGEHHPGGGDGSGASYGAGSFEAVGGAGIGAGAVHAAIPTARHTSLPSPPQSVTDGIRLAGDADPSGTGGVGGSGSALAGAGNSRLPLSWSTPGGGPGGAGGYGAVGASGGFSGVSVPSTSTPGDGWWNRSPSAAVGPAAQSPTAQLTSAKPTAAGAGGNTGVGMVPHGGGSGSNRQRDERQTWLTEDDEDIFRAKPATPGLIE